MTSEERGNCSSVLIIYIFSIQDFCKWLRGNFLNSQTARVANSEINIVCCVDSVEIKNNLQKT